MQTLWSRITPTTCTCRCPSCVFRKAASARRQVATARRFLVRPIQSATFTYSAVFAGACLIDGKLKRDRRKELDAALVKAREGTERLQGVEEAALSSIRDQNAHARRPSRTLESATQSEQQIHCDKEFHIRTVTASSPYSLWGDGEGFSWEELGMYEVDGRTRPEFPETIGSATDRRFLPPQSWWATSNVRLVASDYHFTERKLRMNELVTGSLILDIILSAGLYSDGARRPGQFPATLPQLAPLTRTELANKLSELRGVIFRLRKVDAEDFDAAYNDCRDFLARNQWIPRYGYQAGAGKVEVRNRLLYRDFTLCIRRQNNGFKDLAVRVCDNLLGGGKTDVLRPPDHTTWNILLAGFKKLGRRSLVGAICDAMVPAKVRPNEFTCVMVLNHYTTMGDATGFTRFVDLMRGLQSGLMLARSDLVICEQNQARLLLKENSKKRKIIQKVAPTPMVYNALVTGLLRFLGVDFTMKFCQELHGDGWAPDKKVLAQLLQWNARGRDWDGSVWIWEQYQKLMAHLHPDKLSSPISEVDYEIGAIMLWLCAQTGRRAEFEQIFSSAVRRGFDGGILKNALQEADSRIIAGHSRKMAAEAYSRQVQQQDSFQITKDTKHRRQPCDEASISTEPSPEPGDAFEIAVVAESAVGSSAEPCSRSRIEEAHAPVVEAERFAQPLA